MKPFLPTEMDKIMEDYESGISILSISRKFSTRSSRVSCFLKRAGVDISSNTGPRRVALSVGRPKNTLLMKCSLLPALSGEEWAYVAGFFDGEGCISAAYDRWSQYRVAISQKDLRPLVWMQEKLNAGIIKPGFGASQFVIDPQRQVYQFLRGVLPYSIVKAEKVKNGIEFLESKYGWKGGIV